MGSITFFTEVKPIVIQNNHKLELTTICEIDRFLFENKLEYAIGLTEDGIVFDESYRSINIPGYEDCSDIPEAIALRLIINKILKLQSDIIFEGEILLTYDDDEVNKIKIENNVILTAYQTKQFSELIPLVFKLKE